MAKKQYSQLEYNELVKELNYLEKEKTEEIKEAIKVAKSFGDLSENSEYDEARNEQAKVAARIAELTALIENAEIIDESTLDLSVVNVGSVVKVKNLATKEETVYYIVGSRGNNPFENKISVESPLGTALSGKRAGDKAEVHAPCGIIELEVLDVTR